jgi:hypothetical protein
LRLIRPIEGAHNDAFRGSNKLHHLHIALRRAKARPKWGLVADDDWKPTLHLDEALRRRAGGQCVGPSS